MLTEKQLAAVMAAAYAVSNLGHGVNEDRIRELLERKRPCEDARFAVGELAGHLMENDEHENLFGEEAEMWEQGILRDGVRHWINRWSRINNWLQTFEEFIG